MYTSYLNHAIPCAEISTQPTSQWRPNLCGAVQSLWGFSLAPWEPEHYPVTVVKKKKKIYFIIACIDHYLGCGQWVTVHHWIGYHLCDSVLIHIPATPEHRTGPVMSKCLPATVPVLTSTFQCALGIYWLDLSCRNGNPVLWEWVTVLSLWLSGNGMIWRVLRGSHDTLVVSAVEISESMQNCRVLYPVILCCNDFCFHAHWTVSSFICILIPVLQCHIPLHSIPWQRKLGDIAVFVYSAYSAFCCLLIPWPHRYPVSCRSLFWCLIHALSCSTGAALCSHTFQSKFSILGQELCMKNVITLRKVCYCNIMGTAVKCRTQILWWRFTCSCDTAAPGTACRGCSRWA